MALLVHYAMLSTDQLASLVQSTTYKAAVETVADLPAQATKGDCRVVNDDASIYAYDGNGWYQISIQYELEGEMVTEPYYIIEEIRPFPCEKHGKIMTRVEICGLCEEEDGEG